MKKLLAICIPTFNRAEQLDRQLTWLAEEIKDFETDCEIIVSDNCSGDRTPDVIRKWQQKLPTVAFTANRNSENLGWMRNFTYCLNASSSQYTWIIGDDDYIAPGTLSVVLKAIKEIANLTLMYLNFSGRHKETGAVIEEHWFDTNLDKNVTDGKAIFQHCIEKNIGSVIFVTAAIVRTDLARIASEKWADSVKNWGGLGFWTGYCAAQGSVLVTSKNYMECTMGVSYWQKDPKAWFGIRYHDIPEIYVKLQEIGYPREFCRRNILNLLKEDLTSKERLSNIKYYLWCMKAAPRWSLSVLGSYISAIYATTLGARPTPDLPVETFRRKVST